MLCAAIKVVFFDLDNTLFDHARAEQETLRQLRRTEDGELARVDEQTFLQAYHLRNTELWRLFAQGGISGEALKVRRFELTMADLGVVHSDCEALGRRYMQVYSEQVFALPGAHEILQYCSKKYTLGLLSNGFPETQKRKLANLGFESEFAHTVFSGDVGALKPDKRIFDAAEKAAGSSAQEIVYIGDSHESDIVGAKAAGWHAIFFNITGEVPAKKLADVEISDLRELYDYL